MVVVQQIARCLGTFTEALELQLPVGAKVLSVGLDFEPECLVFWCLVDDDRPRSEVRHFSVVGNDHSLGCLKNQVEYVGTVARRGLHVFERLVR